VGGCYCGPKIVGGCFSAATRRFIIKSASFCPAPCAEDYGHQFWHHPAAAAQRRQTVVTVNNVAPPRQHQRNSNKCAPREFGTKLQKKEAQNRKQKKKERRTVKGIFMGWLIKFVHGILDLSSK